VTPDILFPTVFDPENFGESSFDNALPWVRIKAADYSPAGDLKYLLPSLLTCHEDRVKTDKDFLSLQEDISEFNLQRKKNLVSLNEAERRKERDVQEARLTSREARKDIGKSAHVDIVGQETAQGKDRSLLDDGLQADERNLANELAAEKSRKNAKDVLLNESAHILSDEVDLLKSSARIAACVKSGSGRCNLGCPLSGKS